MTQSRRDILVEKEPQLAAALSVRCSCSRVSDEAPLTVCRKRDRRADIVAFEIWKIGKNFVLAHSARQIIEDVVDCDSKPADARLAASLAGLDGDACAVVHDLRVEHLPVRGKIAPRPLLARARRLIR